MKLYALKMAFNYHDSTVRGARHRHEHEFAQWEALAASRAAVRRAGGRDGLVVFHTAFVDKATLEMVAMMPEDMRGELSRGVWSGGGCGVMCARFGSFDAIIG